MPAVPVSGFKLAFPTWQVLAGLAAVVAGFVDAFIWSPAISYFALVLLLLTDTVLTDTVRRAPFRPIWIALQLVAYTFVLALAHTFGKHEPLLSWLPHLVFAGIVGFHFLSLLKALGKLHLMREELTDLLSVKLTRKFNETAENVAASPVDDPDSGQPDGAAAAECGHELQPGPQGIGSDARPALDAGAAA